MRTQAQRRQNVATVEKPVGKTLRKYGPHARLRTAVLNFTSHVIGKDSECPGPIIHSHTSSFRCAKIFNLLSAAVLRQA